MIFIDVSNLYDDTVVLVIYCTLISAVGCQYVGVKVSAKHVARVPVIPLTASKTRLTPTPPLVPFVPFDI